MFSFIFKGAPFGNKNAKKDGVQQGGTKSISGLDLIKVLKKRGWSVDRVNGSHHIMQDNSGRSVPVPAHREDLGIGLRKKLQKQLGFVF